MPRTRSIRLTLCALLCAGLLLTGCNFPSPTATQENASVIYTAAAQTIIAQATLAVQPTPAATFPVQPTATAAATSAATAAPPPSATSAPQPSATTIPCDRAEFVQDLTVPDNTAFEPGKDFTKTWRLKNTGSCNWDSGYALVFVDGDALGGPPSVQLTSGTVSPGQTVDVSVSLKAPQQTGSYQGDWQLRNGAGKLFGVGEKGDKTFWVRIQVALPSGIALDLLARASAAEWSAVRGGSTVTVDYNGSDDDPDGAAKVKDNVLLEDGKTSAKILATFPPQVEDGVIQGLYPEYTVQAGDRFQARIGFIARSDGACGSGDVVFLLQYREGSSIRTLAEWSETCNGRLKGVDVDLASLVGKKVRFILAVDANGAHQDDLAIWASPRIER